MFKEGDKVIIVKDYAQILGGSIGSDYDNQEAIYVRSQFESPIYKHVVFVKYFGFRTDLDYHDRVVYEVKFHPQEIRNNKLEQLFT